MTQLTYTLPAVNENNSTADPKTLNALSQILSTVNGNLDASNLAASLQQLLHSPGDIKASARSAPETGWLACDGSAVSRSTYSALFAAIGTSYGTGDGSTTFNLPDARGRSLYGLGTQAQVASLGLNDGRALSSRSPVHSHGMASHTHDHSHTHAYNITTSGPSGGGFGATTAGSTYASGSHTHTAAGNTSSPDNATTGPPSVTNTNNDNGAYIVVNYFVKT